MIIYVSIRLSPSRSRRPHTWRTGVAAEREQRRELWVQRERERGLIRTLLKTAEAWLSWSLSQRQREVMRTSCSFCWPMNVCTTILYRGKWHSAWMRARTASATVVHQPRQSLSSYSLPSSSLERHSAMILQIFFRRKLQQGRIALERGAQCGGIGSVLALRYRSSSVGSMMYVGITTRMTWLPRPLTATSVSAMAVLFETERRLFQAVAFKATQDPDTETREIDWGRWDIQNNVMFLHIFVFIWHIRWLIGWRSSLCSSSLPSASESNTR